MNPRWKPPLLGVLVLILVAGAIFLAFERHLAGAWFALGIHPEVFDALEQSLDDQKSLADHEPEARTTYRQRFEEVQTLLQRLRILELNRSGLVDRYQALLLLAFLGTVALVIARQVIHQRRQEVRLARLRAALADLAEGRTDITLDETRRDTIGRIAAMVERTSRVMARDRRRLKALENLSAWQEAARRHAHEMRTPLTGARLELTRLDGLLEEEALEKGDELRQVARSAHQEIERLSRFAQEFTSFARLPRPAPRLALLSTLSEEFVATYEMAWANLTLETSPPPTSEPEVLVDRDLLRQVLVNLCDNSSLALGSDRGTMRLELTLEEQRLVLDVHDDGPGIENTIQSRLFEPYTTTRGIGQGMGLGLAISKKILLDHGGDLELLSTSPSGTTFRLTLPRPTAESSAKETDPIPNPFPSLRRAEA